MACEGIYSLATELTKAGGLAKAAEWMIVGEQTSARRRVNVAGRFYTDPETRLLVALGPAFCWNGVYVRCPRCPDASAYPLVVL